MTSRTPVGPARARPGSTPGGVPGRRAITDQTPPSRPAATAKKPTAGMPGFGRAELQLLKSYLIAIAIVILITVVVPMIMAMVGNY